MGGFEETFAQLVARTGALQQGHFQLASGLHSSRFFRCIKLLERPGAAAFLFDALAAAFPAGAEVVLGANEAGSILAFEVAQRLGARLAIARQVAPEPYRLIDGFGFAPGERVLIVDDITTTGGTAKQLLQLVQGAGAEAAGVGLIATKGLFQVQFPCPVVVLAPLEGMDAVEPDDCPLCQQGVPLSR